MVPNKREKGCFGSKRSASSTAAADSTEILTIGDAPKSELASFEPGAQAEAVAVAHGTLTVIGAGDLLLAGGLAVEAGFARTVVKSGGLRRLSQPPDGLRVTEVAAPDFVPTAYHAVARLRSGEVIIVGGSPGTCAAGLTLCGSTATFRFTPTTGTVRPDSALLVPRLGQAVTVLCDQGLLITGGLTESGSDLTAISAAELYGASGADLFGRGAGATVGPSCGR